MHPLETSNVCLSSLPVIYETEIRITTPMLPSNYQNLTLEVIPPKESELSLNLRNPPLLQTTPTP